MKGYVQGVMAGIGITLVCCVYFNTPFWASEKPDGFWKLYFGLAFLWVSIAGVSASSGKEAA